MEDSKIEVSESWLIHKGFRKLISFEIDVAEDNSLIIAWNDVGRWYAMFRNKNKGQVDDVVCLRNDIKYISQVEALYRAITDKELQDVKN